MFKKSLLCAAMIAMANCSNQIDNLVGAVGTAGLVVAEVANQIARIQSCDGVIQGAGCCKVLQAWAEMGGDVFAFGGFTQDNPTACCGTNGITCEGTKITGINWADKNLKGTITSLKDLKNLKELTLAFNDLEGSIEPVSNMKLLQKLDLGFNDFTGSIEPLTDLTNLKELAISKNLFTGSISPLRNLKSLTFINLNGNQFTGPTDSLNNLKNLEIAYLPSPLGDSFIPDCKTYVNGVNHCICSSGISPMKVKVEECKKGCTSCNYEYNTDMKRHRRFSAKGQSPKTVVSFK